jgi:hypothetical protein
MKMNKYEELNICNNIISFKNNIHEIIFIPDKYKETPGCCDYLCFSVFRYDETTVKPKMKKWLKNNNNKIDVINVDYTIFSPNNRKCVNNCGGEHYKNSEITVVFKLRENIRLEDLINN